MNEDDLKDTLMHITRIQLSDVEKFECFTLHARTWVQWSNNIYYWKIRHILKGDEVPYDCQLYELWKFNFFSLKEEKVPDFMFEEPWDKEKDNEGAEQYQKTSCGIFRYKSMLKDNINFHQHRDADPTEEKKFLKSLMVAFPM